MLSSLSAVSNLTSSSGLIISLLQKFFLIYSLGAPWNLYIYNTAILKASAQNSTANISHAIVRTVPQYLPILSLTTPIKKGEGKSPSKCIQKIATATACGRKSSSTALMSPTFAGPTLLNNNYINKKNSPIATKVKKKIKGHTFIGCPNVGPIIAASKTDAQEIDATKKLHLLAFSVRK